MIMSNPKEKKKPNLRLDIADALKHTEQVLVIQQSTSSYVIHNFPQPSDETDSASSSLMKSSKQFFNDSSSFGDYYHAIQKSNGREMQDRYMVESFRKEIKGSFIGVYDGHSTSVIAEKLSEKLHKYIFDMFMTTGDLKLSIREAFKNVEKESLDTLNTQNMKGGSTAICAILQTDKITVANLGDSRAAILNSGSIKLLSEVHDFTNKTEENEVDSKGGLILKNRLQGVLAITRSIGDKDYKSFMRSDPDIIEHLKDEKDEFLFIGTDGFWNSITHEEILKTIKILKLCALPENNIVTPELICEKLIDEAYSNSRSGKLKRDNITLVVADLKKHAELEKLQSPRKKHFFNSETTPFAIKEESTLK